MLKGSSIYRLIKLTLLFSIVFGRITVNAQNFDIKKRVIILTDLGADPDDKQSLTRLLLYSNDLEIEGLIATSTTINPREKTGKPNPDEIKKRVKAYGKVLNNLRLHSKEYPSEEYLLSVIKQGTLTGRKFGASIMPSGLPVEEVIGEGKDTEASDLIVNCVYKNDPRPIWICAWGGPMDLAQALWRIRNDHTKEETSSFVSRIRVYSWGQQDLGGQWIRDNFPDLFQINSIAGILYTADPYYSCESWINSNVRFNHGDLGGLCPIREPGIGEADSETFLGLIPNGLDFREHPDWGGWGGRMKPDPEDSAMWIDIAMPNSFQKTSMMEKVGMNQHSTICRWAPEFQNDYEARMDWCVNDFTNANHPPKLVVNKDSTLNPIYIDAKPGEKLSFDASASTDPDNDLMFYRWFVYDEVSTIKNVKITYDTKISDVTEDTFATKLPEWEKAKVELPEDGKGVIHLILAGTDYGKPALTRYRRIIISVE